MADTGPFGIGNRSCIVAAIGKRYVLWSLENHFVMCPCRWTRGGHSNLLHKVCKGQGSSMPQIPNKQSLDFNRDVKAGDGIGISVWMTIWVGKVSHIQQVLLRDGNLVSQLFWSGLEHVCFHSKEQLASFQTIHLNCEACCQKPRSSCMWFFWLLRNPVFCRFKLIATRI